MTTTSCHNCGSIWSPGSSEWEWQQCSACGWTPGDPVEEDEIDPDDYDEFEDQPITVDPELVKEFINKVSGSVLDQGLPNRFNKKK